MLSCRMLIRRLRGHVTSHEDPIHGDLEKLSLQDYDVNEWTLVLTRGH